MNDSFHCWQDEEHARHFDHRVFFPSFRLGAIYGDFNEMRLFREILSGKEESVSLLDVGCATGEFSRYFRYNHPKVDYTGCDISEVAIQRAKQKYPGSKFFVTDSQLSNVQKIAPDYVFCRDVLIHQEDPFGFLKMLCSIPRKGLFLRIRTRDVGASELNFEKSCQLNYEQWAPYMILNCEEIVSFLKSLNKCSKVIFVKDYMVLGGQVMRFLPKDCYLESTGTAETALYIEFGETGKELDVIERVRKEQGKKSLFDVVLFRVLRKILRNFPLASVRW